MRTNRFVPYLFLLPAVTFVSAGAYGAALYNSVVLSFYDWSFEVKPWSDKDYLGLSKFSTFAYR